MLADALVLGIAETVENRVRAARVDRQRIRIGPLVDPSQRVDHQQHLVALHRHALAAVSGVDDPAKREGFLALERNFHGHLVGGATDTAALHLKAGAGVFQRAKEEINRITLLQFLGHLLEGTVNDALGKVLLAALHDDVDQMGNEGALVTSVRDDLAFLCSVAA